MKHRPAAALIVISLFLAEATQGRPQGTGTGVPVCFGDGSGAPCPCANEAPTGSATGCLNSGGVGGRLESTGTASLSNDDFVLRSTDTFTGTWSYFFQGDALLAGGQGVPFSDGLRCCGDNLLRLVLVAPQGANREACSDGSCGVVLLGHSGPISEHPGNAGLQPGDTRCYQSWYRDTSGPCSSARNLTNAVSVTWIP